MSFEKFSKAQLKKVVVEFSLLDEPNKASEDELREALESSSIPDTEIKLSFPEFADLLDTSDEEEDDTEDDESEGGVITSDTTPSRGSVAAKKAAAKKAAVKKATTKPKTVVPDDVTLIKMTRNNPVYEVRGYRFERSHPFVLVKDEDVDFLIEVEGGFTVAKKSEIEAFYN